ncbi:MAG: hypothetical protein ACI9K5_002984 [Gammaproteobacteria bacterium]|jgi:hypothetical protein
MSVADHEVLRVRQEEGGSTDVHGLGGEAEAQERAVHGYRDGVARDRSGARGEAEELAARIGDVDQQGLAGAKREGERAAEADELAEAVAGATNVDHGLERVAHDRSAADRVAGGVRAAVAQGGGSVDIQDGVERRADDQIVHEDGFVKIGVGLTQGEGRDHVAGVRSIFTEDGGARRGSGVNPQLGDVRVLVVAYDRAVRDAVGQVRGPDGVCGGFIAGDADREVTGTGGGNDVEATGEVVTGVLEVCEVLVVRAGDRDSLVADREVDPEVDVARDRREGEVRILRGGAVLHDDLTTADEQVVGRAAVVHPYSALEDEAAVGIGEVVTGDHLGVGGGGEGQGRSDEQARLAKEGGNHDGVLRSFRVVQEE